MAHDKFLRGEYRSENQMMARRQLVSKLTFDLLLEAYANTGADLGVDWITRTERVRYFVEGNYAGYGWFHTHNLTMIGPVTRTRFYDQLMVCDGRGYSRLGYFKDEWIAQLDENGVWQLNPRLHRPGSMVVESLVEVSA